MLSLNTGTLLLALYCLVCDFGSSWLEFWFFIFTFTFSDRNIFCCWFSCLIALTQRFLMIQCKAHEVLLNAFEVRENRANFGVFGFLVHYLEHSLLFVLLGDWLWLFGIKTYLDISLQIFQLRVIKHIPWIVLNRKGVNLVNNWVNKLLLNFLLEVFNFLLGGVDFILVDHFTPRCPWTQ